MPLTLQMKQNGGLDLRNGRGPLLVDGAEAAQAQCIALSRTQEGEWAFNLQFGIPYDSALLGKFFDDATSAQILAAEFSDLPTVSTVAADAVTFTEDLDTRTLGYVISPVYPVQGESFAIEASSAN